MRWLKSPALHMAAIGGAVFGVAVMRGGAALEERPRAEVAPHRLEQMLEGFVNDSGRLPTDEERARMLDAAIDDEVLYQYALILGLHENPAARSRLAKIAEFVEANPHHDASEAERAEAAMELGLHHGDMVVRRILVDGARRLIRAVVLLQEPTPERLEGYLAAHPESFTRPPRVRLSQVMANAFKWPDSEARARELLARIESEALDPAAAVALGDQAFVEPHLRAMTEQALATKLGADFASRVIDLPAGRWAGPIPSRYGHHAVFVHQRHDAQVPPLDEIRDQVAESLRQQVADEWLALRLRELRAEFEVVVPEGWS